MSCKQYHPSSMEFFFPSFPQTGALSPLDMNLPVVIYLFSVSMAGGGGGGAGGGRLYHKTSGLHLQLFVLSCLAPFIEHSGLQVGVYTFSCQPYWNLL